MGSFRCAVLTQYLLSSHSFIIHMLSWRGIQYKISLRFVCGDYRQNRIAMEVTRTVANYGLKSSSFSEGSVCEEHFDSDSEALRVVQDEDEDQNASTQNMDGEQKAKVLHGRTKGLSSCFEGIVHIFKHIFPCQDAHGDDDKDPLLEDPSPQGQGEVENGSTQVRAFEDGSTAEAERGGGTQSVTAAAFRRPRGPKSPGLNPGSGAQHN